MIVMVKVCTFCVFQLGWFFVYFVFSVIFSTYFSSTSHLNRLPEFLNFLTDKVIKVMLGFSILIIESIRRLIK